MNDNPNFITDEEPFVMVTYDPDIKNRPFKRCEEHAVFTNYPQRVATLPPPSPASTILNSKPPPSRQYTIPDSDIMKTADLVTELMRPFINAGDAPDTGNYDDQTNTDEDKVRTLFYWLASMDINNRTFGMTSSYLRVSYQLQQLQRKTNTYAAYFSLLCHHAGIPCVIIHGYVKGSKYNIGERLSGKMKREWNAVLINGEWHLVDVLWGAQNLARNPNKPWFLFPNPKHLIYSHFPEEENWQLLENPISTETFTYQAYLKQRYFDMGLCIVTQDYKKCYITETGGKTTVEFQIDPNKEARQEFRCVVRKKEEDKWIEVPLPRKNVSIEFVSKVSTTDFYDMDDENDTSENEENEHSEIAYDALSIEVRYPKAAEYRVEVLGKETDTEHFDWVAVYRVRVTWAPDWPVYFPRMPVKGWGRNPYLEKCGLRLYAPVSGTLKCFPGPVMLKFKILPNAPTNRIRLGSKITDFNEADVNGDEANDQTTDDNPSIDYSTSTINDNIVSLPLYLDVGERKVTVYAMLNDTDKGEVCNYLITCKEPERVYTVEELMEMRRKLNTAVERRDVHDMKTALDEATSTGMYAHRDVRTSYISALAAMTRLLRLQRALENLRTIDRGLILTLRQYNQPTEVIVRVLQATFMLLDNQVYDWRTCQSRLTTIGRESVIIRMERIDVQQLTRRQVQRARELTRGVTTLDTVGTSEDVAPFMRWVEAITDQYTDNRSRSTSQQDSRATSQQDSRANTNLHTQTLSIDEHNNQHSRANTRTGDSETTV